MLLRLVFVQQNLCLAIADTSTIRHTSVQSVEAFFYVTSIQRGPQKTNLVGGAMRLARSENKSISISIENQNQYQAS